MSRNELPPLWSPPPPLALQLLTTVMLGHNGGPPLDILSNARPSRRPGRPTVSTPQLRDRIFELLWNRVPLRAMCRAGGMPSRATIYRWRRRGSLRARGNMPVDEPLGARAQRCVGIGCVESLSRDDLNPLKIIKDGAYCPDRDISVVASGSTMSQETINIASSQIRRDHAVAQKPIAQIGQYLHLQTDGSRRISQLRQLRPIAFSKSRKREIRIPKCSIDMKSSPFLAGKRSLRRSSDHKDYAASFTEISASQASLGALVGIIRNSA
jgi:hypothetical protein